jgi:hypothetical protein
MFDHHHHHHHHHVTQSSHSINAIGPAPLWSGRKREHCSLMFDHEVMVVSMGFVRTASMQNTRMPVQSHRAASA